MEAGSQELCSRDRMSLSSPSEFFSFWRATADLEEWMLREDRGPSASLSAASQCPVTVTGGRSSSRENERNGQ